MNTGPTTEQTPFQPYGAPPPKKKPPVLLFVLLGCGGCFVLTIPILAAILFPVFAQARMKARDVSCMSNIRQQTLGMEMYLQDYDQTFPVGKTWIDDIDPYVKNPSVYHCPEVTGKSHDMNDYGYAFDSKLGKKTLSEIKDPGTTLMFYDSSTLTRNATDAGTSVDLTRHGHSGNVSYVDGHPKRLSGDGGDSTSP